MASAPSSSPAPSAASSGPGDVPSPLAGRVTAGEIDPRPVSGRQELYENVVNRHIWVAEERARIETGAGR